MFFDQSEYDLRCEWALPGLLHLAPSGPAVVIVDILSFSTAADIAVARGASVIPGRWKDDSGVRVSPASLRSAAAGSEVVLPSPNGAALSLNSGHLRTYTACLRNAPAIAAHLAETAKQIAVIPAGERWPDNTLRPCAEDWIGAGAVLALLPGRRSPEADMAVAAFEYFRSDLRTILLNCASGRELVERGFQEDVELASEYSASAAVPLLTGGRFVNASFSTAHADKDYRDRR